MRLEGKVAIITGGGSGIGAAYCKRFLAEGAKVMVADIGEAQAKETTESLAKQGEIDWIKTDISNEESTLACVATTRERFGDADILINNAAIYGDWDPADASLEYLKKVFDVNVHGQWLMAKAVTPAMVKRGSGRVINVASIAGYLHQISGMMGGDPENFQLSNFSYAHSKFSVFGLTRHMAGQLGQFGVTVNCIAPGLTLTDATDRQVPEPIQPMFAQMSAMRTNVEAEDMVGTAVYFASEDAARVNGQVICIDGGNVMPV
jgi:NAD(P)-dependent dehydrogenase (short-subunit alcohol dehydrogenase family)